MIAVVALSWRLLGRSRWPAVLEPLATAVSEIGSSTTVAVAASKADRGLHPEDRLADLLAAT